MACLAQVRVTRCAMQASECTARRDFCNSSSGAPQFKELQYTWQAHVTTAISEIVV